MRQRFIELTSGWIPVSVLLLLATGLIAGQPRAEQSVETSPLPETVQFLDHNDQARLATIRHIVDSVLPVPESLHVTIDVTVSPAGNDAPANTNRLD